MVARWSLILVYLHAVWATECLVGCLVQDINPFDDDDLVVWADRGTCDSSIVGCEVSAINYPSSFYQGALWVSTLGPGDSGCTCSICDPYPWGDTTSYMAAETSLWSRIHCYLVASEASGYDVSPCVAAIVDTGTLPCVDDAYEPPTVDQFECEENLIMDLTSFQSYESCNWDGDVRMAQEMFSGTSASSSTTGTNVVMNTDTCLVGCLVQDINPFDDGVVVWDNRATCDSSIVGCEVSAINYPSSFYQGALWVSTLGPGDSGCTCSICDPYPWGDTTSYMAAETSLWSRIHCYLVASEASGYDVSPCVAAIVDTGTLPCVDDAYEPPTVDQFECEENLIMDLTTFESYESCSWPGAARSTDEFYSDTRVPSPLSIPTTAPVPSNTRDFTPQPGVISTDSPDPTPTTPLETSPPSANGPQPGITSSNSPQPTPATSSVTSPPSADDPPPGIPSTDSPDPTPAAPLETSLPSSNGPQPGTTSTNYPEPTPTTASVTSPPSTDDLQRGIFSTDSPDPTPTTPSPSFLPSTSGLQPGVTSTESPDSTILSPPRTSPPSAVASTTPREVEGDASCALGNTCEDGLCCDPDTSTCGREYTFCQQRDFLDGPRCCSGVNGDPSASNVCSEDSICNEPDQPPTAEDILVWVSIIGGVLGIIAMLWRAYWWCKDHNDVEGSP